MGKFAIEDGQTILFIGDSITDCGRRGTEAPLGSGYVRIFSEMITGKYPERAISYINKGIGGHRITDLQDRWKDDVLFHKPDWLSIKIGINDLNSHLGGGEGGVSPEKFEAVYDAILSTTREELGCPILLISPFFLSNDTSGRSYRSKVLDLLPRYLEVVYQMSERYGTRLVRLHDLFQHHLTYRDAETFCPEPVHPHHTGHLVIAQAVEKALTDG